MQNPLTPDLDHILSHTLELWDDLRGQRIFLTGGTGFFGCWLLESFAWANDQLNLNAQIHVLTRDPEKFSKKAPHLSSHPAIQLLKGDVRNFAFPDGHFSHIIHAATEANVGQNTEQMKQTIVEGTKRVLSFAKTCGAQKLLLTSSGAVYGKQPSSMTHMPEDEDAVTRPLAFTSAYAEGKREAERLWLFHSSNQSPVTSNPSRTIARGYAFVGPYLPLDAHFAIGNFIRDALKGKPIIVNGDGTTMRSYLYGTDLAIWLWTILCKGEDGRAYNVGSEHGLSIGELALTVARLFSPPPEVHITKKPLPAGVPDSYVPSTKRARTELGLQEWIPLTEATKRTIAWYAEKPLSPLS